MIMFDTLPKTCSILKTAFISLSNDILKSHDSFKTLTIANANIELAPRPLPFGNNDRVEIRNPHGKADSSSSA